MSTIGLAKTQIQLNTAHDSVINDLNSGLNFFDSNRNSLIKNYGIVHISDPLSNATFSQTSATAQIQSGIDYIAHLSLTLTLPELKVNTNLYPGAKIAWCSKIGFALIQKISIDSGSAIIDVLTRDSLNMWYEIYITEQLRKKVDKMIGNIPELTTPSEYIPPYTLTIPLPFGFTKSSTTAIPMILTYLIKTLVHCSFSSFYDVINYVPGINKWSPESKNFSDASITSTGIIMSETSSKNIKIDSKSYNFPFEITHMITNDSNTTNTELICMIPHPVKSALWFVKHEKYFTGNFKFLAVDAFKNTQKIINEATMRFVMKCAEYKHYNKSSELYMNIDDDGYVIINPEITSELNNKNNNSIMSKINKYEVFKRINAIYQPKNNKFSHFPSPDDFIFEKTLTIEECSIPISDFFFPNMEANNIGSPYNDIVYRDHFNYGLYIDHSKNPIVSCNIKYVSSIRVEKTPSSFFDNILKSEFFPNSSNEDGICTYPFCIDPCYPLYSGSFSLGGVENMRIGLEMHPEFINNTLLSQTGFKLNCVLYCVNVYNVEDNGCGGPKWQYL